MFNDHTLIYKKGFIIKSVKKTVKTEDDNIRPNIKSLIGPQDLDKLIAKLYK